MPAREAPSYSSTRVQRASRLNALEHARLQQRLMLLEKAKLHQARLTNQDIRVTSLALEYILACSGHSPEGRGPHGEQGGVQNIQQEDPCFLYGERVVSRKVRRVARPQSAVERATFRRNAAHDASSTGSGFDDTTSVRDGLPPRPQSSPARRRTWAWSSSEETDGSAGSDVESEKAPSRRMGSPAASRPSTAGPGGRAATPSTGRITPRQPWEDDTDEITKRLLKAQQQQQQRQQEMEQREAERRSQRYMQDLERKRSQRSTPSPSRGYFRYSRTNHNDNTTTTTTTRPLTAGSTTSTGRTSASGHAPTSHSRPTSGVIEDRKPVSPAEKRSQSGGISRRAGLSEIMSQSRPTMSASAWRAHLASTATVPRSSEAQRQLVMEARKGAERERQQDVMQRVESFMDQLVKKQE